MIVFLQNSQGVVGHWWSFLPEGGIGMDLSSSSEEASSSHRGYEGASIVNAVSSMIESAGGIMLHTGFSGLRIARFSDHDPYGILRATHFRELRWLVMVYGEGFLVLLYLLSRFIFPVLQNRGRVGWFVFVIGRRLRIYVRHRRLESDSSDEEDCGEKNGRIRATRRTAEKNTSSSLERRTRIMFRTERRSFRRTSINANQAICASEKIQISIGGEATESESSISTILRSISVRPISAR